MMSSVARGGQRVARAVHVAAAAAAPPTAKRVPAAARRNMGGHARHIGLPGEHVPIHVGELHKNLGTVYLTTMFLWMMYRAKQDGLVLLGFEHPWDHMHEHGDGHDEPAIYHFTKMDDGDDEEEEEEEEEEEAEEEEEGEEEE